MTKPTNQRLIQLQSEIYQRQRRGDRFSDLLPLIAHPSNLYAAWDRVSANDGAFTAGSDSLTCDDIAPKLTNWINEIRQSLISGSYTPNKLKTVTIPKSNGSNGTRRLGILTVRDRLVHSAIRNIFEPLLEPRFCQQSYGFRPGRSVPGAIADVTRQLETSFAMVQQKSKRQPKFVAVHIDVSNCFDNIQHERLVQELSAYTTDARTLKLIAEINKSGATSRGVFLWRRNYGIVQGSSFSPLLCNAYLHPIDQQLQSFSNTMRTQGVAFHAWRYADDLLLAASTRSTLRQGIRLTQRLLKQRDLYSRSKPQIKRLETGIKWLGLKLKSISSEQQRSQALNRSERHFAHFIPTTKIESMNQRITDMTSIPSDRILPEAYNHDAWIESLNQQVIQWFEVYQHAANAAEVFAALDEHARESLGKFLKRTTRLSYKQLNKQHRHYLPLVKSSQSRTTVQRSNWTWRFGKQRLLQLSTRKQKPQSHFSSLPAWQV